MPVLSKCPVPAVPPEIPEPIASAAAIELTTSGGEEWVSSEWKEAQAGLCVLVGWLFCSTLSENCLQLDSQLTHSRCKSAEMNYTCGCETGWTDRSGSLYGERLGPNGLAPASRVSPFHRHLVSALASPVSLLQRHVFIITLYLGHLADAFVQSDLQRVHLLQQYITVVHKNRNRAVFEHS